MRAAAMARSWLACSKFGEVITRASRFSIASNASNEFTMAASGANTRLGCAGHVLIGLKNSGDACALDEVDVLDVFTTHHAATDHAISNHLNSSPTAIVRL